jgi:hypothetical protein
LAGNVKDADEANMLARQSCMEEFPEYMLTQPSWFELVVEEDKVFFEELREGFRCAKELYPREQKFEASYLCSMDVYHKSLDEKIVRLGGESVRVNKYVSKE